MSAQLLLITLIFIFSFTSSELQLCSGVFAYCIFCQIPIFQCWFICWIAFHLIYCRRRCVGRWLILCLNSEIIRSMCLALNQLCINKLVRRKYTSALYLHYFKSNSLTSLKLLSNGSYTPIYFFICLLLI